MASAGNLISICNTAMTFFNNLKLLYMLLGKRKSLREKLHFSIHISDDLLLRGWAGHTRPDQYSFPSFPLTNLKFLESFQLSSISDTTAEAIWTDFWKDKQGRTRRRGRELPTGLSACTNTMSNSVGRRQTYSNTMSERCSGTQIYSMSEALGAKLIPTVETQVSTLLASPD